MRLQKLTDLLARLAARLFSRLPLLARQQCNPSRTSRAKRPRAKHPIRCWFERLEAREVFNVTYQGGALIPHVEAQAVFLGSQWTSNSTLETEAASIDNFLGYAVQSPYMDLLTDAGYNVGQGTYTTGARVSTTLTATTTDATIRTLLQAAINIKLVQQPDQNRLYLVYMPSGITVNDNGATSQTTFLGYHGAFAGTDVNKVPFDIHYVVVPHPGTPNPTSASQGFTGAAEAEVLNLGGTTGGTLLPTFNGITATSAITRTDEQQTVSLSGSTTDGSFKLAYNGTAVTVSATPVNEVQTLSFGSSTSGSVALSFNSVSAAATLQKNEVQKLTLGGADGSTFTLSYENTSGSAATALTKSGTTSPTAAAVQAHLNTIPALANNVVVTGSAGGPFTITYQGALSSTNVNDTALVASDAADTVATTTEGAALNTYTAAEIQANLASIAALTGNVMVTGSGPYTIIFGGSLANTNVNAIVATPSNGATATVTTTADGSFNADNLKASLNTIPELNGNVSVTGTAGSALTVTFINALTGINVSQLTLDSTTGGIVPTIAAKTQGALPTAAQVQASLSTIAALSGNVTVTGSDGGPFTITIKNLGNVPKLDVSTVTGGLMPTITSDTDGIAGLTSDLDEMTAVTSHELAESVTDPDVNYKTLGWYDTPNNVEIGDLNNSVTDVPNITTRLGPSGYLTQQVFNQSHQIIAPDTTSIVLKTTRPDGSSTATGVLTGVTVTQLSSTQVQISWLPVDKGVTGYRVYLVNGSTQTLLSRVPSTARSTIITGLPSLTPVTLKVEAYNAVNVADALISNFTMSLPAVTAPVLAQPTPLTATSAQITWNSTIPSGAPQTLTLGGTATGKLTPSFNNVLSTMPLTWTDEQQKLTLGGASGGTVALSFNGVSATTTLTRNDEVQKLTIAGSDGDTIVLSYNGVAGSDATMLTIAGGVLPSAADVQTHLNSIPALAGNVQVASPTSGTYLVTFNAGLASANVNPLTAATTGAALTTITTQTEGSPTAEQVQAALNTIPALAGNVYVTGPTNAVAGSSDYTITFGGRLTGVNVSQIVAVGSGGTATVAPIIDGSAPTATQVKASLNTIPALAGKVTVTQASDPGSPYVITVTSSASAVAPIDVSHIMTDMSNNTTGLTASITAATGASGFRIFKVSGSTKTLVSTLLGSATTATVTGLTANKQVSFIVEAFRGSTKADSAPMSVPLTSFTMSTVTRTAIGTTGLQLSWAPVTGEGVKGYRVYRLVNGKRVLMSTVAQSTNNPITIKITGLPANTKYLVEAFNGSQVADSPWV